MDSAILHGSPTASAYTLPNGLTIALEPLPHVHSVSAGVWIRTGPIHETAHENGVSHFLEHLLFKGTEKRTARRIVEDIEAKGGHINAVTSRDYTCVYVKVLDSHCAMGIDVLADVVRNSQLRDVEKERNVIIEEINSVEDIPEELAHDLFAERLWPGHPLGRPIQGTLETVRGLNRDAIEAYYRRWYQPGNMVFTVAGRFDPAAVHGQIAEAFADMDASASTLPDEPAPPAPAAIVEAAERDIGQSHLCFGYPGALASAEDRYVHDLLGCALGGGSTSRLFERVREDEGLAYAIYSFQSSYTLAGMFGVYAAVAPENLQTTLDICSAELHSFATEPLSDYELELNREQLKGGLLMALENTSARMARLAKCMLYHGRILPIHEVIQHIDAVTASDVQAAAQELFQPGRCCMTVVGPKPPKPLSPLPHCAE